MYIGHYAAAGAMLAAFPALPVLPVAVAVAYPDLLWPFLVYAKKEKVHINPHSPLQKDIHFEYYPHSHSLIKSAVFTIIPSVIFGVLYSSFWVAVAFFMGALSHWLLDTIVHKKDLPVVGFGKNEVFAGFGLWNKPALAFAIEYVFFAACMLVFAPNSALFPLLAGGFLLHMLNANSFFGFTKNNPTKTPNQYASLALFGFAVAIAWFVASWS